MGDEIGRNDIVIIIPGILGSVLVKDGRELWAVSGQTALANLLTLGGAAAALSLPPDLGDDDPNDGVVASALLPKLHLIPHFWKVDGYGRLVERLTERARQTHPAHQVVFGFPYDWRLSCRLNAARLAQFVEPRLERWRRSIGDPDAKAVLVCHSMGGLIALWYIDVLGGRETTRALITIGTPFKGSVNALTALTEGMAASLGPVSTLLDQIVRSMPSTYQLLPTYPAVLRDDGTYARVCDVSLPLVDSVRAHDALDFHERIAASQGHRFVETFAIKGAEQPTFQSVEVVGDRVHAIRSHKGTDYAGDGTVPRPSSHPPHWNDDRRSVFVPQTHAMLPSTPSVITQVSALLSGKLANFMGGAAIGLHCPDTTVASAPFVVEVTSPDRNPNLALEVLLQSDDGLDVGPRIMTSAGDGFYRVQIGAIGEGTWRITARAATTGTSVESVSDAFMALASRSGPHER
jgi:hypothetical protein